ncbi:ABC transporter substrate-binding protein/permease [Carnobacteriaceae bacterium zg-ZUI78]|uniref:ABC transporter substrate-binding protein/permease n=1 Tax=Granulicatella sp. zg-84 TaxID=2678503 RepID=UPI001968440A|nr:ABC transporter substrate-binding protein/permease [Granulicatella sp. zg-84]MBS4750549.1 ABC transporter substrate-binding protein/permease [Carnobacteriaceae bacterium zg-ZUI78]
MKIIKKIGKVFSVIILFLVYFITSNNTFATEVYTIATDTTYAPFEWVDTSGEMVGLDMDLLKAIARNQGFEVRIKALGFNAALQALESNQVDGVIAGMSITEARKAKFNMSDIYFEDDGIVVATKKDSTIQSLDDLKGKHIAIKIGTAGATYAQELAEKYGFTTTTFEDSGAMVEAVLSGNSDALFDDSISIEYTISSANVPLKTIKTESPKSIYGFASTKDDKGKSLVEKFNAGLKQLKESGEYATIVNKYLGGSSLAVTTQNTQTTVEDTSIIGILRTNGSQIFSGLCQTLLLTFISIVIALILGMILGLFSVSHNKVLMFFYQVYIDIMRGTPLLVLAFFVYFAIPQFFNFKYTDAFLPSLITLGLNAAAYIGELFRAGINAVDKGQFEASSSLGLPYHTTMRKVILPQALKVMIPPFINQFVMTLKDTSILSAIGLVELTQTGRLIIARTYASGNTWVVVAAIYIILITLLTKLSALLEKKWH